MNEQKQATSQKRHLNRRRRSARQGGNAMLEAALIFLPMMAMFLGIVDVSLAVYIQSTLTQATREGARFAITFQSSYNGTSCASSQATCIESVVQNFAVGVPGGLSASLITVNYYTAKDLNNPVMSCNSGTCTQNGAGANGSLGIVLTNGTVVNYDNQPGNIVEVVVSGYPWNWLMPLNGFSAGKSITLGAASMDVLGALAVGTTTPPNP
jgi:Flp pilus assembly protein TadG